MRTIIAGSRNGCDPEEFARGIIASGFYVSEVVCGCANGIDTLGFLAGHLSSVPVHHFPAQWDMYGRAAGHLRNTQMARHGEQLIAFLEPGSRGTANMISQANELGLPIHIHRLNIPRKYYPLTHKQVCEDYGIEIL